MNFRHFPALALAGLLALPFHAHAADDTADGATAADNAPAPADPACSAAAVDAAMTVRQLRALRQRCLRDGDSYARILLKTNNLPLPLAPALHLQAPAPAAESEQTQAGLGIYFYLHESYPTEADFNDLDSLIRALGQAWRIDAVNITGSVDVLEARLSFAPQLAHERAEAVHQYLLGAGLDEKVPVNITIRRPTHDDSEDGRAEDRAAEFTVKLMRRRPPAAAAAATTPDDGGN